MPSTRQLVNSVLYGLGVAALLVVVSLLDACVSYNASTAGTVIPHVSSPSTPSPVGDSWDSGVTWQVDAKGVRTGFLGAETRATYNGLIQDYGRGLSYRKINPALTPDYHLTKVGDTWRLDAESAFWFETMSKWRHSGKIGILKP